MRLLLRHLEFLAHVGSVLLQLLVLILQLLQLQLENLVPALQVFHLRLHLLQLPSCLRLPVILTLLCLNLKSRMAKSVQLPQRFPSLVLPSKQARKLLASQASHQPGFLSLQPSLLLVKQGTLTLPTDLTTIIRNEALKARSEMQLAESEFQLKSADAFLLPEQVFQ